MKLSSVFFLCAGIFFSLFAALATAQAQSPSPKKVYVIPIRDDIEATMSYLVRRGVKEAMDQKAAVLIVHMNTNGGRVDYTEDIIQSLDRFEPRGQTYTLIDTKALSAGAFIAAATKHIYMTPSSVIGALTPIMLSPGGASGPVEMPKSAEEKMSSAIRALVRASAEKNGHNTQVFDAMVDRDQGLTIAGKEIVAKGKILTLTSNEAAALYGNPPKPLLSQGTVQNLETFIRQVAGEDARVQTLQPTGFEKLARLITMVSPFLMTAALLLGYIEFKTPGFGLFGILAAACALIFFFGHYVAGLSGHENTLFFFVGVILLSVELFVFPGVIAPGLAGVILITISLLRAMSDLYPTDPIFPSVARLQEPLKNLGFSFLMALVGALVLARLLPKTPLYRDFVLSGTSPAATQVVMPSVSLQQTGKAATYLRPSGTVMFGEQPVDVVTQGDFIEQGAMVRVVQIEGHRVVVEKV